MDGESQRSGREPGTVTWGELWDETTGLVGERPVARWLCEVASGLDGDEFRHALDEPATERMVHHLDRMLARLRAGVPLQYVLGRWGFRRLDLMVDERVLIPRPETELVVETAVRLARTMQPPLVVADLGTGSGAIGLALADELVELRRDGLEVWLTDASDAALDVARANLAGLGRAGASVRLAHGDWFDALPPAARGELALVVSNPPYVRDDDPDLEPVVRDHEPVSALFGGADGLDHVRRIVADAATWLRPGGAVVLEIGTGQGAAVAELLTTAGLADVAIATDLAGHERIAQARRPR